MSQPPVPAAQPPLRARDSRPHPKPRCDRRNPSPPSNSRNGLNVPLPRHLRGLCILRYAVEDGTRASPVILDRNARLQYDVPRGLPADPHARPHPAAVEKPPPRLEDSKDHEEKCSSWSFESWGLGGDFSFGLFSPAAALSFSEASIADDRDRSQDPPTSCPHPAPIDNAFRKRSSFHPGSAQIRTRQSGRLP